MFESWFPMALGAGILVEISHKLAVLRAIVLPILMRMALLMHLGIPMPIIQCDPFCYPVLLFTRGEASQILVANHALQLLLLTLQQVMQQAGIPLLMLAHILTILIPLLYPE